MVFVAKSPGRLVGCAAVHPTPDTRAPERGSRRRAEPAHTAATRPVFLDASGRRQRRVRRFGRLLVIPAAGYVALLLSAALGGPTVSSPYLPLPAAGGHPAGVSGPRPGTHKAPDPTTGTPTDGGRTAGAAAGHRPAGTGGTSSPAAPPSESPTPTATTPAAATATATHGKSAVSHPVPSHTSHGHG